MRRTSCFYLLVASVLVLLQGSRSDHPIHAYTQHLPEELVVDTGKDPCDYLVTNATLQLYADDSQNAIHRNTFHFEIMDKGSDLVYNKESLTRPITILEESSCVERNFAGMKREDSLVRHNVRQVRANNRDANTKRVTEIPARSRNTRRVNTDNRRLNTDTRRLDTDVRRQNTDARRLDVDARHRNTDTRRLDTDARRHNTDTRRLDVDTRRISSDSRRLDADARRRNTDTRRLDADARRLNTDTRRLDTDVRRQNTDTRSLDVDTRRLNNTDTRRLNVDTRRLNIDTRRLSSDSRRLNANERRIHADSKRLNTDNIRLITDKRRVNTDITRVNTDTGRLSTNNRRRDSVSISVRRDVDSERVVGLRSREDVRRSVSLNDDTERYRRQAGMNEKSTERKRRTESNRRRETDETRVRNQVTLRRVREDGRFVARDRRIEEPRTVHEQRESQGRESRSAHRQNERSERSRNGNTRQLEDSESRHQESYSRNDISFTERTRRERHDSRQIETHRRQSDYNLSKQREDIRIEEPRESRHDISRPVTTKRSVRDTISLERNHRRITDQRRSMSAGPENLDRYFRKSNRDNVRETKRRDDQRRQTDNRSETLISVRSDRRINTRSPNIEVRDDKQRGLVRETRIPDQKIEAARRDVRNEDSLRNRRDFRSNAERSELTRDFELQDSLATSRVMEDRQRTTSELRGSAYNQRRNDKRSTRDIREENIYERRDFGRSIEYRRKAGHDLDRRQTTSSRSEDKQDVRLQATQAPTLSKVKTEVPKGYVMSSISWFKSFASDIVDSLDVAMVSRAALLGAVGYMGQNIWQKSV